jgi:hypothetical protein
MAWQGVPFLHQSLGFMDSGVLTLNRIPLITVDTGFGWDAILASLIAAIVGGAIPAYISWRAIKNNNDSLMQDRETQSRLAEKQLTAQLVVSSRQQWINDCREYAARYIGSIQLLLNIQNRIHFDLTEYKEKRFDEIVNTSASKMHDTLTDATFYKSKIELLLNPNEEVAIKISKIMTRIIDKVNKYSYAEPVNYDEVGEMFDELKNAFSAMLKDEWERIKRFE